MQATLSDYSIYRQLVSQLMSGEEQLPSLPTLTWDIRRLLADPAASSTQLVALISQDPALSALLMKYASFAMYRMRMAPKTLQDVLRVLGLEQVDRLVMVHSVKSLFPLHSPRHRQLFNEAWNRLTLKASICAFLARQVGNVQADHGVLACLLSEVGSLAVLSAFKKSELVPTPERYRQLCRAYSKSLSVILLKQWAVHEEYIEIVRKTGQWELQGERQIELIDLINLSLYHTVYRTNPRPDLPPINSLSAYAKLIPPTNELDATGCLQLVSGNWAEIEQILASLR